MLQECFLNQLIHVSEIMVPRVDMVCLDIEDGIEEFLRLVRETGISRIPVYEEKPDNIMLCLSKMLFAGLQTIKLYKISTLKVFSGL